MLPKLNWNSLCETHKKLSKTFKPKDGLVFTLFFKSGQTIRKTVEFRDFLKFLWYIDESHEIRVDNLTVTDHGNNLIYQYINKPNRKIPKDKTDFTVRNWNSLSASQKETYLKLLYAQLQFSK